MVDFNVTTAVTTTQTVTNGTGTVSAAGSILIPNSNAAIIASGNTSTIDISGATSSVRTAVILSGQVDLEVKATGSIASAAGEAISGSLQDGSKIVNKGSITATSGGITLGAVPNANPATPTKLTFENEDTINLGGTIRFGSPTALTNTGTYDFKNTGTIQTGIAMEFVTAIDTNLARALFVDNSGTMNGLTYTQKTADGDHMTVVNRADGTINGNVTSITESRSLVTSIFGDAVDNSGTINGNVTFGNQADRYDGANGKVTGSVRGGGGRDSLNGGRDNDKLFGENGNDFLNGNGGDDILDGGKGNDLIDGGDGTDTAQFTGVRSDYSFLAGNDGVLVESVEFGTDFLKNIENVSFKRGSLEETFTIAQVLANGNENTVLDISGTNQNLIGTLSEDVFVINGNAADYAWGTTQDGQGVVIWKDDNIDEAGDFDILTGFEKIRFNDQDVSLVNTPTNSYKDVVGQSQHLVGKAEVTDTFVINANRADYTVAATLDSTGVVVWKGDDFDVLNDFEQIQFNDVTIALDEFSVAT